MNKDTKFDPRDVAIAREAFQIAAERENLGKTQLDRISGPRFDYSLKVVTPEHYKGNGMEAIDVIDAFNLGLYEGRIVQHIIRYKKKDGIRDLREAAWYLDRLIKKLEKENPPF